MMNRFLLVVFLSLGMPVLLLRADDNLASPADAPIVAVFGKPAKVMKSDWVEVKIPFPQKDEIWTLAGLPSLYSFADYKLALLRDKSGAVVFISAKARVRLADGMVDRLKELTGCLKTGTDMTFVLRGNGAEFLAFSRSKGAVAKMTGQPAAQPAR